MSEKQSMKYALANTTTRRMVPAEDALRVPVEVFPPRLRRLHFFTARSLGDETCFSMSHHPTGSKVVGYCLTREEAITEGVRRLKTKRITAIRAAIKEAAKVSAKYRREEASKGPR